MVPIAIGRWDMRGLKGFAVAGIAFFAIISFVSHCYATLTLKGTIYWAFSPSFGFIHPSTKLLCFIEVSKKIFYCTHWFWLSMK